jgi:hypothetical protein
MLRRLLSWGRTFIQEYKMAKKLKNEPALLKEALRMVMDDAVTRGVVEFEATDSHNLKIEFAYRLLVHDKKISPLPNDQLSLPKIKHRLAMWVTHQLPADHALLK